MDDMPPPMLLTIAVDDIPGSGEVPSVAALTGRAYKL